MTPRNVTGGLLVALGAVSIVGTVLLGGGPLELVTALFFPAGPALLGGWWLLAGGDGQRRRRA